MVALARLQSLTLLPSGARLAVVGGIAAGAVSAAAFALMPLGLLERLVVASGVASLVAAAAPPLGTTARAVLALGTGFTAAAVAWSALYLLVGPGGMFEGVLRAEPLAAPSAPVVRRADAHPDAPPRRPVSASELGTPLMDVEPSERTLPRDLEQPLAAFDPGAILAAPREPVRPVTPLAARPAPKPIGRIETFALAPLPGAGSGPKPDPAPPQTIEALLRRLEQGANRRAGMG